MPLSLIEVKEEVTKVIGRRAYQALVAEVKRQKPKLWGTQRPSNFVEAMVLAFLFKDIKGVGYQKVHRQIDWGFVINQKSIDYNIRQIRKAAASWGQQHLKPGRLRSWTEAAKGTHKSKVLGLIHLWMDSCDFRLARTRGVSKKGDTWSFKENSPAQRWMLLSDAQGRVRKLYGGYSPKVYDSHFLHIYKKVFEKELAGASVIADQHFRAEGIKFKNVRFVVAHPKPHNKQPPKNGKGVKKLTKAQQKWNKELSDIRSRVESPFGIAKTRFAALSKRWQGESDDQDYLVMFAFGLHNFLIKK